MQVKGAIEIIGLPVKRVEIGVHTYAGKDINLIVSENEARILWTQIGLKLKDLQKETKEKQP